MDSVLGLVFNNKKQLLLVKRRDVPVWVLPGGGMEKSETPAKAVVREVLEESGFKVKVVKKVSIYSDPKSGKKTHLFKCVKVSGRARLSDESKGVGFYSKDKLPIPFHLWIPDWLKDAETSNKQPLRKPMVSIKNSDVIKNYYRNPVVILRFFLLKIGLRINT